MKIVRSMLLSALFSLLNSGLVLFSIVGFPWLRRKPSLSDVNVEIKAFNIARSGIKLNQID
jgi:hypothetical protein